MTPRSIRFRNAFRAGLLMLAMIGFCGSASLASPSGLVDQTGGAFDEAAMRRSWHLVYFGYMHCPEICPTSLFEMTASLDMLPEVTRKLVTPVFVTLDPARDTAEAMAKYVEPLGHGFITVTGPLEAIDRFAATNRILAIRNGLAGENYSVDHTSTVLLFDLSGKEVERFPYEMDYREVARRVAEHVASAPRG